MCCIHLIIANEILINATYSVNWRLLWEDENAFVRKSISHLQTPITDSWVPRRCETIKLLAGSYPATCTSSDHILNWTCIQFYRHYILHSGYWEGNWHGGCRGLLTRRSMKWIRLDVNMVNEVDSAGRQHGGHRSWVSITAADSVSMRWIRLDVNTAEGVRREQRVGVFVFINTPWQISYNYTYYHW